MCIPYWYFPQFQTTSVIILAINNSAKSKMQKFSINIFPISIMMLLTTPRLITHPKQHATIDSTASPLSLLASISTINLYLYRTRIVHYPYANITLCTLCDYVSINIWICRCISCVCVFIKCIHYEK